MSKYETMEDFAGKCSWEGGLASLIFEYGVTKEDLGPNLIKFWPLIEVAQHCYSRLEEALNEDGFSSYDF